MRRALEIVHFNQDNKILAYIRDEKNGGEEPVLVIINFGNKQFDDYGVGIQEGRQWKLRINSVAENHDDDFSDSEADDLDSVAKSTDDRTVDR